MHTSIQKHLACCFRLMLVLREMHIWLEKRSRTRHTPQRVLNTSQIKNRVRRSMGISNKARQWDCQYTCARRKRGCRSEGGRRKYYTARCGKVKKNLYSLVTDEQTHHRLLLRDLDKRTDHSSRWPASTLGVAPSLHHT